MTSPSIFACLPEQSRGRRYAEPESPTRTPFQRDRDRIIHSDAFRRLQYKTQVFVYHEGDHYRTRLTHSLEVAQITRSICRQLGLNEDLAEAVALAHDLGHTPFGHAGEDALSAAMAPYGGFDHNEQAFRLVTEIESHYAKFDGLNLSWECLEGMAKHNGPILDPRPYFARYVEGHDLELASYPGAEAQIAGLADDIAYNNHDLADGLRAGILAREELEGLPLVGEVFARVDDLYPGLEPSRLRHEAVRRLINTMVEDLLAETRRRMAEHGPCSAQDVRALDEPLAAFSAEMQATSQAIKRFLFERLYRHFRVNRMTVKARRIVSELFAQYQQVPICLPDVWRRRAEAAGDESGRARLIADYIAGMTDRYAMAEHAKLFDLYR